MPLYHFKAVARSGDVLEGDIEALTQSEAIDKVHDMGHLPIRADEVDGASPWAWLKRDLLAGRRLSPKHLSLLTRELAVLLQAKLPMDHALDILVNLAGRQSARDLLARVRERVRGGASLADAMAGENPAFPQYYVSMVRAGESGGALESVVARLAEYLERSEVMREQVKSALLYPLILLVLAGLSVVLLLTVVIPEFKPLFEDAGEALPLATQILVAVGDFLQRAWWMLAAGLVAAVLLTRRLLADAERRHAWDRSVLRLPILGGLVARIEVSRFSRMLGTLLENGVPLLGALSLVGGTLSNSAMARAVAAIAGRVKQGQGLAKPLGAAGVFPSLAVDLIRVGEETGQLEEMLFRVADIYERETGRALERLMALLVPVLTIGLGMLIAAIIGSVLMAILSLNKLAL